MDFTSYHGTKISIAENQIKYSPLNIKITNFASELNKGVTYSRNPKSSFSRPKIPGSLGYGFYTFIYTKELAEKFISRQIEDYKILKVVSTISDDELLDFNDYEMREKFHVFRTSFLKHAEQIMNTLGNPSNSYKQHSTDGIVIEYFISKLEKEEKKTVSAVQMWTYTPCEELDSNQKYVSFVPNGLELCIRNKQIITLLE